jgi:hypothetical protein
MCLSVLADADELVVIALVVAIDAATQFRHHAS